MSGIRTGSRLDHLLQLQRRIAHEIDIERARENSLEAGRLREPRKARRKPPTPTPRGLEYAELDARLRAAAPAADVRLWALAQGIPCPTRGRISVELRQQYLNHLNQQHQEEPAS